MSWTSVGHRLAGLLRTRVLLSGFGLFVIYNRPEIGQWVVILVGLALGVSAIDAMRVGKADGQDKGDTK